jgi:hypothetical protein
MMRRKDDIEMKTSKELNCGHGIDKGQKICNIE